MTDVCDLAARVADLRKQIAYHNERYHTLDSPEIADADFDLLVRELLRLETEHPELVSADSPTTKVGGAPLSATFAPVVHRVPMTSLDNAMDEAELTQWGDRVARGLAGRPADVRLRAEDRRPGDEPALRGRQVRAGGHPRRRPGR